MAGTDTDTEKHPHAEVNDTNHSDNAVKVKDVNISYSFKNMQWKYEKY